MNVEWFAGEGSAAMSRWAELGRRCIYRLTSGWLHGAGWGYAAIGWFCMWAALLDQGWQLGVIAALSFWLGFSSSALRTVDQVLVAILPGLPHHL